MDDDLKLAILIDAHRKNPDNLPYLITEHVTNASIRAYFQITTTEDLKALETWPPCRNDQRGGCSVFLTSWIAYITSSDERVSKLVTDADEEIQGLLHLDAYLPYLASAQRLLEAAPHNQYRAPENGSTQRTYRRVGKALVIRIVLECLKYQQFKVLTINLHPDNVNFYKSLYFEGYSGRRMHLSRERAKQLVVDYFFPRPLQSG